MSANPKRKMCWNCEGNIELDQEVCPYCRTPSGISSDESASSQDPFSPFSQQKIISANPFASQHDQYNEDEDEEADDDALEDSSIPTLYTMSLLMSGSLFLLFGFVLFLFSSNGQLVLRWNSAYWYLYVLLALPMLYLSVRSLSLTADD